MNIIHVMILGGMLIILAFVQSGHCNHSECEKMKTPKMLRSCCKVPHSDENVKKCRRDILSSKGVMNELATKICIAECVFQMKSYLTAPYEVDLRAIEKDLQQQHATDSDFVKLMLKGFKKCLELAKAQSIQMSWLQAQNGCNFFPATLLACALETVYEECPAQKWHNTSECNEMRDYLLKCDQLNDKIIKN